MIRNWVTTIYIAYNILYFLHYTNVLADSLKPDLSRPKESMKKSQLEAGDESLTKTMHKNMQ